MQFPMPSRVPDNLRSKLMVAAFAGGHGVSLWILAGAANSFNGLFIFLEALVSDSVSRQALKSQDVWTYRREVELRGDWSVVVRPLEAGEI
jgi:hypothetical protein